MFVRCAAVIAFLVLGACTQNAAAPPQGDPAAGFRQDLRGRTYQADAMAAQDGAFYWAQTAMASYRKVDAKSPPQVETLQPAPCDLPKPAEDAIVRHVHLERGVQAAPLYQFSSQDVGARAKFFVESYVASKGTMQGGGGYEDSDVVRVVNVAVTERDAPVFLVLSAETNILWNILPGDGARVDAIVLIGIDDVGVAHAPQGAPVYALTGGGARRCGAWPMRRPKSDWSFVRNAEDAGGSMDEILAKNRANAAAYSHWLVDSFGPGAEVKAVVLQGASNVLVGPPPAGPEARVAFRPITEGVVRMTENDYRVVASEKDYVAAHRDILVSEATRAAGGDLKNLLAGG